MSIFPPETQHEQTIPQEEQQTDSIYLDYCSMIDQSNVISEPAAEKGRAATLWKLVFDLFKRLVNFVTMIFSIIVMPK